MLAIAGLVGWFVAAVMVGLYLGERGRRKDAQRREGVIAVDPVRPAIVTPRARAGEGLPPASVPLQEELASMREKYIAESVAEGFAPEDAAEDFDLMMAGMQSDAVGTFSTESARG